jgi:glutathione S-transferase
MPEIKLYQLPPFGGLPSVSPFCVKVHDALRYKRLNFEIVNFTNPMGIRRINPRGKVPTLTYDGATILDSTDIIAAVESRHPEPRLYPAAEPLRSQALMIEDWADESLYWHAVYERWMVDEQFQPFAEEVFSSAPAPLRMFIKSIARRQVRSQLRAQGLGRLTLEEQRAKFTTILGWLENRMGSNFLLGPDLTIADLAVAAPLKSLDMPGTAFSSEQIRKHKRVAGWLDRVKSAVS